MQREEIITRIKAHEAEIRASGIKALYLFGSVARGDFHPGSDVDLACDIDEKRHIGLFEIIGMQHQLEDLIGEKVDLVERKALHSRIAKSALQDSIRIY